MPVTRDLSEGKRLMIVKWLEKLLTKGDSTIAAAAPAGVAPSDWRPAGPPPEAAPPEGSKTRFAKNLSRTADKEKDR
jgi:hypothetical protein